MGGRGCQWGGSLRIGQSHLIHRGQHLEQIRFVPASSQALVLDAAFGRLLLLEQVQRNMTQNSEVLSAVAFSDTTVVFPKRDIQHPVQAIFNSPVCAYGP